MEEEIEVSARKYKADGNKSNKESGRRLLHLYKRTGDLFENRLLASCIYLPQAQVGKWFSFR